ncbi:hypothetical protein GP486_002825 [Trichoglossum hirsutum]|uniref:Uncharacterized protein n=1 Tax=Trichoglossum hirsutum TaxID=265104 RepID=A0A9P8RRR3_9PEZI|nr:hypothetical protein GP486_002825 [Trichoglossum hirsutum]
MLPLYDIPLNSLFLTSILSPIGRHRSSQIVPSNGKRSRKRKRKEAQSADPTSDILPSITSLPQQAGIDYLPPQPEISSYLTIGLNSTTRVLELLAQKSIPESLSLRRRLLSAPRATATKSETYGASTEEKPGASGELTQKPLVAVFVARSTQPALLHAHLPLLTATASLSRPKKPPIALVTLPKGAEVRLTSALGLPRVSVVGLSEGAPGSAALVEFVRENVKPVDVEWLVGEGNEWRGTEIRALKTTIGGRGNDKSARKASRKKVTKMRMKPVI